jgi:hypothetical protein
MSALANVVKLHPRLSAGLAFELGVMAGAYLKAARGKRGLAGATAKLIDAVPLIPHASPARRTKKRKVAVNRPRAKRAKVAARSG